MSGGEFFDQFIDDYHAECDEHLAAGRRALLAIEADALVPPDPQLLRELFRSLHTLKGLSGMVGDACAERVAHALEESLRSAEGTGLPLAPSFLDAFFAGVELLERCIASRRSGAATVDPEPVLERLAAALDAGSLPAPRVAAAPDAHPAGDSEADAVYHFEFVPSGELAARGVSVDVIRARLRELGTLLEARPRMVGSGLVFDFWVSVSPDREPEEGWSRDGMHWTRAQFSAAKRPTGAQARESSPAAPAGR